MKIPRLFLSIGAMKAGTSLLYELLRDHPQIEVVPIKEVNYLPHVYTDFYNISHGLRLHHLKVYSAHCEIGRSVQQIQKDVAFFSRYLTDPVDDRWFKNLYCSGARTWKAEFSNIVSILEPAALHHIRRLARRARMVYLVRDPLQRLWSHTKFHAAVDWRPDAPKTPVAELTPAAFVALFERFGHHRHGQYTDNIGRLRDVFRPHELEVVFYEDLVADGAATLDAICDFIGIARHSPPAERFGTLVNKGPDVTMPEAFVEAARPYAARELEGLRGIGVTPHPAWRIG